MSSKDAKLPLRHILQAIERIEQHVAGMDFAVYRADEKTADAVERNLQRISEAAIRLGEQGPALCPEIPWADVRGLGNWLRHQYDRIESERSGTQSLKACRPSRRVSPALCGHPAKAPVPVLRARACSCIMPSSSRLCASRCCSACRCVCCSFALSGPRWQG